MAIDRKDIKPFLIRWFPTMENATSDEWHFFLDKVTGIETPLDLENGQAFDRWREKLAGLGYPVFKYTESDIAAKKAKAAAMLAAEELRAASLGKTLADLAKEAPNWTAADVLSNVSGASE